MDKRIPQQDGRAAEEAAQPLSAAPAPWLSTHTATGFASGVIVKARGYAGNPSGKGCCATRGKITTFSPAARRRMREFCITHHVPGSDVIESTLTIPGEVTPEEWRKSLDMYFKRVERAGVALVWRVELQKRKQPHLHVLAYVRPDDPEHLQTMMCVKTWLECLPMRCQRHRGAKEWAVKARYLSDPDDQIKWLAYMNAHASKSKNAQLGWAGKQWGIISRKRYVEREPLWTIELPDWAVDKFIRVKRRWLRSKADPKKKKHVRPWKGSFQRFGQQDMIAKMILCAIGTEAKPHKKPRLP